jgi:ubiquinone biosynthesis protein
LSLAAIKDIALDLRRILLLLWKILQFGLFPLAEYMPWIPHHTSFAVRFRRVLEDLGLTYLKLGQFLALRYDILPPEVCRELNNLFENVRPMTFEMARTIIESELGYPPDELFLEFNSQPIAAASVAQVHEAQTFRGERVAVKIQRRGLRRIFEADIRNLRRIATLIDASGIFGKLSAKGMLNEFSNWTLRELDFTIEGRTAERVDSQSAPFVIIPKIHWALTTPNVLTMDYVEGLSASQLAHLIAAGDMSLVHSHLPGFNLEKSLRRFAQACLTQLFVDGFFHGDPHPGNIMFRNDNRVVFLDFGIFGSLTEDEREILAGQIENLALGEIETSFRYYARQLMPTEETDFEKVKSEAIEVLTRWYEVSKDPNAPLEERHLAKFTAEMIGVSRRNQLRYGLNYLLFWRALNNLNATLLLVDPTFDLMSELRRFFERIRPGILGRVADLVEDPRLRVRLGELTVGLPNILESALLSFSSSKSQLHARIRESGAMQKTSNTQVKWVAAGLLVIPVVILLSTTHLNPVFSIGAVSFLVLLLLSQRRRRE